MISAHFFFTGRQKPKMAWGWDRISTLEGLHSSARIRAAHENIWPIRVGARVGSIRVGAHCALRQANTASSSAASKCCFDSRNSRCTNGSQAIVTHRRVTGAGENTTLHYLDPRLHFLEIFWAILRVAFPHHCRRPADQPGRVCL